MSARTKGRDAWHFFWLGLADHLGVPLIDLGETFVVDLKALHRKRGS